MKLNKQGKDELRAKIVEQLANVPNGQRIHLDKELLEDLLFDEIVCNKETGETLKMPIWSGDFLRKIDLSEISFDNVAWSLLVEDTRDVGYDEVFDEETWNKFNKSNVYALKDGEKVNYSNTNAKIDFSKSWEAKRGYFYIFNCDFSGVDLSNNDMSMVGTIYNANLSNTKIVLTPEIIDNYPYNGERFGEVDFSGVDLSKFTINGKDLVSGRMHCTFDDRCNFSNTGINIIINSDEMTISDDEIEYYRDRDYLKKSFKTILDNGFLVGCYVNGKKVLSKEESQVIASEKREEYQQMKNEFFDKTYADIENQIGKMRK